MHFTRCLQVFQIKRLTVNSPLFIIQTFLDAPVAQLDRVSGYEPEGRAFESLRVRHRKSPRPSSSG